MPDNVAVLIIIPVVEVDKLNKIAATVHDEFSKDGTHRVPDNVARTAISCLTALKTAKATGPFVTHGVAATDLPVDSMLNKLDPFWAALYAGAEPCLDSETRIVVLYQFEAAKLGQGFEIQADNAHNITKQHFAVPFAWATPSLW